MFNYALMIFKDTMNGICYTDKHVFASDVNLSGDVVFLFHMHCTVLHYGTFRLF